MAGLRVEQYVVGPVMTNCYFAVNEQTNDMLIMQPRQKRWRKRLIFLFMRMRMKRRRF